MVTDQLFYLFVVCNRPLMSLFEKQRFQWLFLLQHLSLDVVAGAIISSLFIAKVTGVSLTFPMLAGLGIAVWLIYTADHLWDAYKVTGKARNPRHAFHQRHFKLLGASAILMLLLGLYNILYLPWPTVRLGLVLGGLTGVYFGIFHLFRQNTRWHKEFLAAMVYTVGIFTAPISLVERPDVKWLFLFLAFLLLATINLLLFPIFELHTDQKDTMKSIATELGVKKVRGILSALFLALFFILCLGLILSNDPIWITAQFILWIMTFVLLALFLKPSVFHPNSAYRILGDGIFFLPIISLL